MDVMCKHKLWVLSSAFLLCLVSCGGDQSGGDGLEKSASAPEVSHSLTGIWELRYKDAVGQDYLNVLELRGDNTYTTHMQDATPSDTGQFAFSETTITFSSAVSPQFSRSMRYQLSENSLRLLIGGSESAPIFADWSRSPLSRTLGTKTVVGQAVPTGLNRHLIQLVVIAQEWNQDAVPTWIRIEAKPNLEFDVALHFFSASTQREMRVQLSPFRARTSLHEGGRTVQSPLPAEFFELLSILEANQGMVAPLVSAGLRVYGKHGAVWRLVYANGQGSSVSAETGELILEDVTGYIDQYNADWQYAGELWRKAMEQYLPKDDDKFCPDTRNEHVCIISEAECYWLEPDSARPDGSCVRAPWSW